MTTCGWLKYVAIALAVQIAASFTFITSVSDSFSYLTTKEVRRSNFRIHGLSMRIAQPFQALVTLGMLGYAEGQAYVNGELTITLRSRCRLL